MGRIYRARNKTERKLFEMEAKAIGKRRQRRKSFNRGAIHFTGLFFTPISPRVHLKILGQGCASFNNEFFKENCSCWYCYICCYQVQMKF